MDLGNVPCFRRAGQLSYAGDIEIMTHGTKLSGGRGGPLPLELSDPCGPSY